MNEFKYSECRDVESHYFVILNIVRLRDIILSAIIMSAFVLSVITFLYSILPS